MAQYNQVLYCSEQNILGPQLGCAHEQQRCDNSSVSTDLHGAGEEARVQMSFLSKLEALASSSVRVAEKAAAKLLIVFTDTGLTAALVAKYRCADTHSVVYMSSSVHCMKITSRCSARA